MSQRVGIVVPTLGKRPDYLKQCLESLAAAGADHVCVVAPQIFEANEIMNSGLVHQFVLDPGMGLAAAINEGISALPAEIEYVNWLGDDDLIAADSIEVAVKLLDEDLSIVLVYGSCDYIDHSGKVVWVNKSGQWASVILHFGPDLIPQPGSLFRRSVFKNVGGLTAKYNWAFDFDLLFKLKRFGKLRFVKQTLASFRWHPESLSVEHRKMSVKEASRVRVSHLPAPLRIISWLWEYPVRQATLIAGQRVTAKAQRLAK